MVEVSVLCVYRLIDYLKILLQKKIIKNHSCSDRLITIMTNMYTIVLAYSDYSVGHL